MTVRCVWSPKPIPHPHQLTLTVGQLIEPGVGKLIVRIDLEHEHPLAIVPEERVAVDRSRVLSTTVPRLSVENEHASR